MLVEIVQLLFEQVDLVLTGHDILALLCFFLSLSVHRSEVVVDKVEDARLRRLLCHGLLGVHSGDISFRVGAEDLRLALFHTLL